MIPSLFFFILKELLFNLIRMIENVNAFVDKLGSFFCYPYFVVFEQDLWGKGYSFKIKRLTGLCVSETLH